MREFRTWSSALRELGGWLAAEGVTEVAMEATGVYWQPPWQVLETMKGVELLLVNAHHVKNLPGRKTDVGDACWLAQLLECGLLRGSFVPPPVIVRLRELTRYRKKLIEDRPGRPSGCSGCWRQRASSWTLWSLTCSASRLGRCSKRSSPAC